MLFKSVLVLFLNRGLEVCNLFSKFLLVLSVLLSLLVDLDTGLVDGRLEDVTSRLRLIEQCAVLVDVALQVIEDRQLQIQPIQYVPQALFLYAETIVLMFNIVVDWFGDGGAALRAALRAGHLKQNKI
jgi:hypothetical protein